jgi:Domain of unknown function (DUF1854)
MNAPFEFARSPLGHWVFTNADGEHTPGCVPVRAFPLAAPDEGISLLSPQGHELLWIAHLSSLDAPQRSSIEAALAEREFSPEIRRILSVSSFSTPSIWQIETDRGPTRLTLKGEEDIRRLGPGAGQTAGPSGFLITSAEGVQFRLPNPAKLDRHSRRCLERFL